MLQQRNSFLLGAVGRREQSTAATRVVFRPFRGSSHKHASDARRRAPDSLVAAAPSDFRRRPGGHLPRGAVPPTASVTPAKANRPPLALQHPPHPYNARRAERLVGLPLQRQATLDLSPLSGSRQRRSFDFELVSARRSPLGKRFEDMNRPALAEVRSGPKTPLFEREPPSPTL